MIFFLELSTRSYLGRQFFFFLDILLLKQQFSLAWAILVAFGKMHQKRL
jgi:hypothetical protein